MKGRRGILVIIFLVIMIVLFAVWVLHKKWKLQFVEIDSVDTNRVLTNEEQIMWFTIRHNNYSGFFSIDILKSYGIEIEDSFFEWDNYTYVFTIGHKLKSIEYSYSIFKNRNIVGFPKQLIGIVTLEANAVNKVFIYRIRKMDIDCDYHDPSAFVTYT